MTLEDLYRDMVDRFDEVRIGITANRGEFRIAVYPESEGVFLGSGTTLEEAIGAMYSDLDS